MTSLFEYQEATLTRGINGSLSYSSSCVSEFFDAREYAESGEDTDDDISDYDIRDIVYVVILMPFKILNIIRSKYLSWAILLHIIL